MIKTGVIGGAGYTAGELIRLLINHPDVDLKWVHSSSNAGNAVAGVHQGLLGETDLYFTSETPFDEVDVIFLCLPHGESRKFLELHKDDEPPDDLPQQTRGQPGMFRHRHPAGTASSCTQPFAQQRYPHSRHHGKHRSRSQADRNDTLLMAQRQRVGLQAVQTPASGRNRTNPETDAGELQQQS